MPLENEKKLIMKVEHLSLQYDGSNGAAEVEALSDVNLDIYEGDFICALGPSGCGKTSLLNVMAGLLKATGGSVTMNGSPVRGLNPDRAVVFQNPTLYPWLSVAENVAFGPRVQSAPAGEIKEKVQRYLQLVGLEDFADVKPYELSGGMRQRAALARALINEPGMILLDEPFGALDAFTRESMQALLRRIWKESRPTIFLITHDVDEALTLGDRVVTMSVRPGRIIMEEDIDFTFRISDSDEDVRYSQDYISVRKKILSLVGHGR